MTRQIALALLVTLAACAGNTARSDAPDNAGPDDNVALEVTNRSSYDMDVYLVRGGQRSRLGLAPASRTTRYSLAPAQFVGGGQMRIVAEPITSGRAITSEPLTLRRGQEISLDIPPQ